MKRRALVTGACGFIGGHLVERLLEDGWEVRATDLPKADRSRLSADAAWKPADLSRRETMAPVVQGMDVVFHTAGVTDASEPWELLYEANVLGTEYLLEAARGAGVERIVSWSSYGVYGKIKKDLRPLDETRPVRPSEALGRSMAMQDAVVWRYHEAGLPATVLRPSMPYGPRARGGFAGVIRRVSRLPVVPVPMNRTRRAMSVHVKDVARAASFVAQRQDTLGEEYNLTDDGRYTTRAFLALLAEALGKRSVPVPASRSLLKGGAWLTVDFVPSNSKIKSLDFRFVFPDPRSGIPETIEELRREGYLN